MRLSTTNIRTAHHGESLARGLQLMQQPFAEILDRLGQCRVVPSGAAQCGPTGGRRINELEAMIAQGNDVVVNEDVVLYGLTIDADAVAALQVHDHG